MFPVLSYFHARNRYMEVSPAIALCSLRGPRSTPPFVTSRFTLRKPTSDKSRMYRIPQYPSQQGLVMKVWHTYKVALSYSFQQSCLYIPTYLIMVIINLKRYQSIFNKTRPYAVHSGRLLDVQIRSGTYGREKDVYRTSFGRPVHTGRFQHKNAMISQNKYLNWC